MVHPVFCVPVLTFDALTVDQLITLAGRSGPLTRPPTAKEATEASAEAAIAKWRAGGVQTLFVQRLVSTYTLRNLVSLVGYRLDGHALPVHARALLAELVSEHLCYNFLLLSVYDSFVKLLHWNETTSVP